MNAKRREILLAGAAAALGLPATARAQALFRVVIVGGGFGGATCARYLKVWAPQIDVTLVEPQAVYVACPLSNRILGGTFDLRNLARDYGALSADYKVKVVRASVTGFDAQARTVALSTGTTLPWDRLVLAPGVEFNDQRIAGLPAALESGSVLHAWRGGSRQI
jgi:NADH dehydrogenase FAD-containing subunit